MLGAAEGVWGEWSGREGPVRGIGYGEVEEAQGVHGTHPREPGGEHDRQGSPVSIMSSVGKRVCVVKFEGG